MNLEALKKTIALIEQDHSDSGIGFDITTYVNNKSFHPCGTVACIAGFAIAANEPDLWARAMRDNFSINFRWEARRILGIKSPTAARTLFMDSGIYERPFGHVITKDEALGVLRELRDILEEVGERAMIDPVTIRTLWEDHIERKKPA